MADEIRKKIAKEDFVMKDLEKQLEKILSDEAVAKQLAEAESKEDIQKIFRDNGLELSIPEAEEFIRAMKAAAAGREIGAELGEGDLDAVAGGASVSKLWKALLKAAKASGPVKLKTLFK